MVSAAAVTMSDGSKYGGTLQIAPATTLLVVSGMTVITGRSVAASDDGTHAMTVSASGKSAPLNVTVNAAAPPPPPPPPPPPAPIPTGIVLSPANPTIPDTAPAGALVASVTVTMSDGSAFKGSLSLSGPAASVFSVSGMNIIAARQLTSADDGPEMVTVTATQGAAAMSVRLF